jgi:cellulose synthase/poly-beta-1,6-N-acetylglucosamine synthase-like glycosyltransferase
MAAGTERVGRVPSAADPPTDPRVTIVIPARNEEAYIEAALDSVARQTVPLDRLQVVVVVNGATDRTAEVVRAARERLPRLEIRMVDDPLPGVARAKNIGARLANGDLLVFLDADSRMAPDLVERIIAAYTAGYRAGSVTIAADDGDILDRGFYELIEFGKRLFGIHANMLYCDRAAFESVGGFDESLYQAEDRDLLVRLARAGLRLRRITESVIYTSPRRLHEGPLRVGLLKVFGRWTLGHLGIWRRRPY